MNIYIVSPSHHSEMLVRATNTKGALHRLARQLGYGSYRRMKGKEQPGITFVCTEDVHNREKGMRQFFKVLGECEKE